MHSLVYVIGNNCSGEFGCKSTQPLRELTLVHQNKNIINIFSGAEYTIYCGIDNKGNKQYWSAGNNCYGSCGFAVDEDDVIRKPVTELQSINYFNQNNIKIEKICVNVNRCCTFWMSHDNEIYANGRNMYNKLGLADSEDRYEPELVEYLNNIEYITDIQCTYNSTFALCCTNNENVDFIVNNWCKPLILPDDIYYLIALFYGINKVFRTQINAKDDELWKEMDIFNDNNIIKIRTGYSHSLLLDSNGSIWCYGDNDNYQLGLETPNTTEIDDPIKIPYFLYNRIGIKDIKCGEDHNLAIDDNNCVYSWGSNKYGQCGHSQSHANLSKPKMIKYLSNYSYGVSKIDCGTFHSYCLLANNMHFLFGSNEYNECITYDGINSVTEPFCINHIFKEKTGGKIIKSISLGCNNTKIVVL